MWCGRAPLACSLAEAGEATPRQPATSRQAGSRPELEPRNRLHTSGAQPGDDWDYTITGLSASRLRTQAADAQVACTARAAVLADRAWVATAAVDTPAGPVPAGPARRVRPSSAQACVRRTEDRPGPGWDYTSTGLSARRLQTQAVDASVAKEARDVQLSAKHRTLSRQGQRRALPPRCSTPRQLAELCQSSDPQLARAAQLATKIGIGIQPHPMHAWAPQTAGQATVRDAKYFEVHFRERCHLQARWGPW